MEELSKVGRTNSVASLRNLKEGEWLREHDIVAEIRSHEAEDIASLFTQLECDEEEEKDEDAWDVLEL